MKKYLYLLMMTLCMGFVACGDDESDEGNVSGDAQKFIGGWYCRSNGSEYLYVFSSDGTCISGTYNFFDYYGRWTYDNAKKQLTTTMNGKGWTVSMITDNAWTGFSSKTGESITYQRDDRILLKAFAELMDGCTIGLGERDKGSSFSIHVTDFEEKMKMITSIDNEYTSYSMYTSLENLSISASTIKVTDLKWDYWDKDSETSKLIFKDGSMTLTNYGKENAKMIIEGTIIPTGEKFKGEYGAYCYIKDGERVRVKDF